MPGLEYDQDRHAEALAFAKSNGFDEGACQFVRCFWNDQDANQHVNNVVYFRWYEHGRLAFIQHVSKLAKGSKTHEWTGWGKGKGLILAGVSNKYLRPVVAPDLVMVAHKPKAVSDKRIELESIIWSFAERAPVGKGEASFAAYDYDALKAIPIPAGLKAQLESMMESKAKM